MNIYYLIIKDLIRFFKDKTAVILTFVVPLVLIIIFGSIFGGNGGPRGKISIIFVNESNSMVADFIETKLDSSKSLRLVKYYSDDNEEKLFTEELAKNYVKEGKISAAIILPKDFFADTSTALKFKFYYDPKNQIESALIQGSIQQNIMTEVPRLIPILMTRKSNDFLGEMKSNEFTKSLSGLIGEYFEVSPDTIFKSITTVDTAELLSTSSDTGSAAAANPIAGMVKFESEQLVGEEITNPGLTRTIGGWAVMFLLFSLTGAANSLFEEKQEGSLKRLLCMPIRKSDILWSKYIYTMLLGIVQLFVLFFAGSIIWDVDIYSNFMNLLIVIIVSSAAAVSFGMFITSVASTLNQASGIATLLILVMSAVGGSWFPISLMPEWMQYISKFTITYWSVEAFLDVLWRQASLTDIGAHLLILISIAIVVNFYSLLRFRKGDMF
ncbi:MAG: ABC transporter permease [Melioribacteraceae bacterium]|nr:ABC transporter permease [Melioribacteraceae bacterium]MCF8354235.1 ABC transporter permease [Melioribacteraceae bacterium]MCF8394734.1 ABC transporter permease [Melioribacteraceae bacterium]MCF8417966.1 ABC transporter permease [Melioribacteraceae bacterium]